MIKRKIFYLLLLSMFGFSSSILGQEYTLSFQVIDFDTGLPLQDAQISISPCDCGGITSRSGRFSIRLPQDTYELNVSFIGYKDETRTLTLNESVILRIALEEQEEQLSEVIVRAKKIVENIESPQMGALQLDSRDLRKIPAAVGEFDVLRG
ncbi:MAG: carboxypeptidase-like regulatory domain-containing protein, partial [Flavobacteriaceae bacterium]